MSTTEARGRGDGPVPLLRDWAWQLEGLGRGTDGLLFVGPESENRHASRLRIARAKSVCLACPVLQTCRDHALRLAEPHGVWGGLSAAERRAVQRNSVPRTADAGATLIRS